MNEDDVICGQSNGKSSHESKAMNMLPKLHFIRKGVSIHCTPLNNHIMREKFFIFLYRSLRLSANFSVKYY